MPAVVGHRQALLERLDELGQIVHPPSIAGRQRLSLRIPPIGAQISQLGCNLCNKMIVVKIVHPSDQFIVTD